MNRNFKDTQEIDLPISALDYRLDILRLTFRIEELLENGIRQIFTQSKIVEEDLVSMFISKKVYAEYKKWYNNKKEIKAKIWTKKNDGEVNFNVENFISHNTFGGLIKFIESIKFDMIKNQYREIAPNLEFKIFRNWINYIKDIRNGLAHRTNINPETFLEKSRFPAQSKALKTKELSMLDFKKFVLKTFLEKTVPDNKVSETMQKYKFCV